MTNRMDDAGYVASSEYRAKVLKRLVDGEATPSTIAEDIGMKIEHVSNALTQLREEDLAELLVSEERRKGRIYGATDRGAQAYQTAADIGEVPA